MTSTATPVLPATLTLGAVSLTVSDLDRSVAWYQTSLGLRVHSHEGTTATLGDGEFTVLELVEDPLARPAGRHAGLYHYALLYPTREELARAAIRLSVTQTPIEGASDHRTHEAIYLPDPDGNGIELAADRRARPLARRPRLRRRPRGAGLQRAAGDGRGRGLLAAGPPRPAHGPPAPARRRHRAGPRVLPRRARLRGPGQPGQRRPSCRAGGYHHHLGFNIWRGRGVGPAPEHTVGLRHWTVVVPDTDEIRARVDDAEDIPGGFLTRDPWGTAVAFVS